MEAQSDAEAILYIKREDRDQWLFRGRYFDRETAELACIRILKADEFIPTKPKIVEWRILNMWGK